MTKRKDTIKLLRKTKRTLKKYGWRQGTFGDEHIGFCLLGALSHAAEDGSLYDMTHTPPYHLARSKPHDRAVKLLETFAYSLEWFNDSQGRTVREVNRLLNKGIKKLEDKK